MVHLLFLAYISLNFFFLNHLIQSVCKALGGDLKTEKRGNFNQIIIQRNDNYGKNISLD